MTSRWMIAGFVCACALAGSVLGADAPAEPARQLYTQAANALLAKNVPLAAGQLSKLIEQYPEDPLAPLAALRLAECELAQGDAGRAIEVLEAWIPKLAGSARTQILEPTAGLRAQLILARANFMADKLDAVMKIAREQADIYRAFPNLSAAEKKLLEQIATLSEQASKRLEQTQAQRLRNAAEQVRSKHYAEALQSLAECQPEQLSATWLWRYRLLHAQALLGSGDASAAVDELNRIELESLSKAEHTAVRLARLDAAMALQQTTRAQAEVDVLTGLVEGDDFLAPTVALRAVEVATLRKDRQAARRLALAAKAKYPKFASLHEFDLLLARNALASIEFEEARRILTALIEAPPSHDPSAVPRAHWLLGESHFLSQDYRQAIAAYSAMIESNAAPAWTEVALMQRGKCYELLGEPSSASADYQRVIEEFARSSVVATARARLDEIDGYTRSANAGAKTELK